MRIGNKVKAIAILSVGFAVGATTISFLQDEWLHVAKMLVFGLDKVTEYGGRALGMSMDMVSVQ